VVPAVHCIALDVMVGAVAIFAMPPLTRTINLDSIPKVAAVIREAVIREVGMTDIPRRTIPIRTEFRRQRGREFPPNPIARAIRQPAP
jgi:hypothetical protein